MFKFKIPLLKLNKKNIELELDRRGYNAYDLACYYIKGFKKFNVGIKSTLRTDDYNNSLYCRVSIEGQLIISDFGFKKGMDLYEYLALEKNFYGPNTFLRTLNLIRNDFNLINIEKINNFSSYKTPTKHNLKFKIVDKPTKISILRNRLDGDIYWSEKDIEYWQSYGISIAKLESKGIAPLKKFWITNYRKDGIKKVYNVENILSYAYPFGKIDGEFRFKIYLPNGLPNNKDIRWFSNTNSNVIQNINHIPKSGELLIIQSSFKDICTMEELIPSLNIVAPMAEGMWFSDKAWAKLRASWKCIIYFGNNDWSKVNNSGLKFCRRYAEKYKIPFITTPDNTTSDISDYYLLNGKEETLQFLNQSLTNIKLII